MNSAKAISNRIEWLDMARGFAILLVILGHIQFCGVEKWIYTFHVPLFFLLSGFTINTNCSFFTFLGKKAKSLLIPYFSFGIIIALFQAFFWHSPDEVYVTDFMGKIQGLLLQNRFWDLWYIASLFFLEIFFYIIIKLFRKTWLIGIVSFLISCYGIYYYNNVKIGLFWNIDVCFLVMFFIFFGYFLKQHISVLSAIFSSRLYIGVLLTILMFAINIISGYYSFKISGLYIDIYAGSIGYAPLSGLSALSGALAVIFLSNLITLRPIIYCGRNSLIMYALHMDILIPLFISILNKAGLSSDNANTLSYFTVKALLFILIMTALVICCELINKTRLSVLIGKFPQKKSS